MNWEALGAIGQLFGSIAVFVTLGYLAIQVKHARQETRRALSQGRSEAHRELPAMERISFENRIRGQYGLPGAHRLFYETYLKQSANPDALRYIESILAKPS